MGKNELAYMFAYKFRIFFAFLVIVFFILAAQSSNPVYIFLAIASGGLAYYAHQYRKKILKKIKKGKKNQ